MAKILRWIKRIVNNFHIILFVKENADTSLASKSIRHYGPDIWNSLPESLKSSPSDQSSVQASVYFAKHTMKI